MKKINISSLNSQILVHEKIYEFIVCNRHSSSYTYDFSTENEFSKILCLLEYAYTHSEHVGRKIHFDIPSTYLVFERVTENCIQYKGYPDYLIGYPKILACWISFYRKSRFHDYSDKDLSLKRELLWWMIEDFKSTDTIIFQDLSYCLFRSSVSIFKKSVELYNSFNAYYEVNQFYNSIDSIDSIHNVFLVINKHKSGVYLINEDKYLIEYLSNKFENITFRYEDFEYSVYIPILDIVEMKKIGVTFSINNAVFINQEFLTLLFNNFNVLNLSLIEKIILSPLGTQGCTQDLVHLFVNTLSKTDLFDLRSIVKSFLNPLVDIKQNDTSFVSSHLDVAIVGRHSSPSGVGEDARMFSKCIDISKSTKNRKIDISDFNESLYYSVDKFKAAIICIPPWDYLLERLRYPNLENRSNKLIGYWPWELPNIPEHHSKYIYNDFDEIWVPSLFVKNCFAKYTKKPVKIVTSPVHIDNIDAYKKNVKDTFDFLIMFDFGSSIARKNPFPAVKAFKDLYGNNKNYKLIIKCINASINNMEYIKLLKSTNGISNISIINESLTRSEILNMIVNADCYVSTHRSEGFGRIIAESMLLKTPTIVSNWSGNVDFCNQDNSILIEGKLVAVHEGEYGFYENQVWFDPSYDSLCEGMKSVQSVNDKMIVNAKETISRMYSLSHVYNQSMEAILND